MLIGFFRIAGEPSIMAGLERLLRENMQQMRADTYPDVYGLGTYYRREPIGREWWVTARAMRRDPEQGYDCEDLATYQVSWLRTYGVDPGAKVGLKRSRAGWHIVVIRGDRTIEDPSRVLGM